MRATLSDSQTEKDRGAQARAMLGDRLQEVEDALAEVRGEKRQLEMTVGELRSDIAHSREELATAATIQSDLSGEVSVLAGQLQDAGVRRDGLQREVRSEEHTSELQSLMRISYAVFCLKKKKK